MDVTEKNAAPVAAADGDPAVEKKEVALADAIAAAANEISPSRLKGKSARRMLRRESIT